MNDIVGQSLPGRPAGQATQIEQARAVAEVRAAIMVAMEQPRNLAAAVAEMREVCSLSALADRAFFRVRRGAEHVNGESIHLARELARIFGNLSYGVKELSRDDIRGQSELVAFCWDMQHNTRSEITFIIPHVRGGGEKRRLLTGVQEIYEHNASFAGRRLREAIFAVLPVWFKAEAAEICHRTLQDGGGKPLVQRIADLRTAFEAIGVTVAQLERKRGRKIDDFLPEDVAGLRVVYSSIKREEVTIAEEFPSDDAKARPAVTGDKLDALEKAAETATVTAKDIPENIPADERIPLPGDPPVQREDGWYVVDRADKRAFEYTLRQKIAQARDEHEVAALEEENIGGINALDAATTRELRTLIAQRANELRERE